MNWSKTAWSDVSTDDREQQQASVPHPADLLVDERDEPVLDEVAPSGCQAAPVSTIGNRP